MRVNKQLIWDYAFTEKDFATASFQRWYVARVLTSGTFEDVKNLGRDAIRRYLPQIWLPAAIEHFWEWYLGLPHAHPARRDTYYFSKRAS